MGLKAVRIVTAIGFAAVEAAAVVKAMEQKVVRKQMARADRNDANAQLAYQWIAMKQKGKSLEQYCKACHWKSVAVYGMGEMGKIVYQELKGSDIKVAYGIDKNAGSAYLDGLQILTLEGALPQVDAILVTPVYFYVDIKADLKKVTDIPVVSLEDIIGQITYG